MLFSSIIWLAIDRKLNTSFTISDELSDVFGNTKSVCFE